MTLQTINIGGYANDGTGDDLRSAFEKVNANFDILRGEVAGGVNLGAGAAIFAQKNDVNLEFKTLTSTDNSVVITHTDTTVDLHASSLLSSDTSPQLGGNLDLQDHYIYHGDVQTTIYGIDVPTLKGIVDVLLMGNNLSVDLGTIIAPTYGNIDMNGTGNLGFTASANVQTNLDFGTF
jgi:hypothetical protein